MAQSSIQVVHRTLRVLEALTFAPTALSLTDVSRQVNLHRSTTLRILRTLAEDGYTVFHPKTRTWTVGPALLRLHAQAQIQTDVRNVAVPFMRALCDEVNETVQLATIVEDEVSYLEKIEPPRQAVRVLSEVGGRRPLYCTGLGKCLMSGLDDHELEALVNRIELTPYTENTIVDRKTLLHEVRKIRHIGYSLDQREYNRAVVCVAAPIRDASGEIIAALSVSAIGLDPDSDTFHRIIDADVGAAERISLALGGKFPDADHD